MNTRQLIVRVIISFAYLLLAVGMYRKEAYLPLALWTGALALLLAREDEAILKKAMPRHRRLVAAALAIASILVLIFTPLPNSRLYQILMGRISGRWVCTAMNADTETVKQRREFSSFRKNQRLVRGGHFQYAAKSLLSANMENIGADDWNVGH